MNKNNNIRNIDQVLLAKYLNGEATGKERTILESWINESGKNKNEFEQYKQTFIATGHYYKSKSFKYEPAWNKVESLIVNEQPLISQRKSNYFIFLPLFKYAAIFVLITLLSSLGLYYIQFNKSSFYQIISSENKQVINELTLPDGTIVSLNSNTKLTYPKQFSDNIREVKIEGEAFFEVKPDHTRPFIINAGKAQIKVLGTSFNVSAYPKAETVEVVVKTGKVQVSNMENKQQNEVYLSAGEKGTLFNNINQLHKSVNADPNYYSWKTHDLIFNETRLDDVIRCLKKTYHVDINLINKNLNNLSYTAHFTTQPIDYILEVIKLTFNLELSYENEQYYLNK